MSEKNLIYMSGFHLAKYLFFLSQQPFWSMPYHWIIVSWFDESVQKYYVNFFWKSWLLKRCIFIKNKDPIIHTIDNGPKGLQAIRKINILPNEIQTCKLGFISDVVVICNILIIFTLVFVMCGVGRCIASAAAVAVVANGLQNTFLTADDFPFVLLVNPLV